MTTITSDNDLFTLINVFYVDPENQQELIDLLIDATEETMKNLPGFKSANIHGSFDGKRVINYAQWESKEHFEKMLSNSEAIPHMKQAEALVNDFEPIQTTVKDSIAI
ncbi:antibiotic biosynthesis monooxygenase family protein [Fodinibius halophilus]|uniref:Antibiotic biosynthesis monooxygenase n=1 Tax=Fodinibius halophilus TaxID=1736908 RepID=A0A6M1TM36_9BACT|nr:antibiotic biosynthesis monooxygenase family protein [Fodinibius halophilus]NGP89500.1 antibiotic biosynthesis monooxygenase [Fodinibius halophilus]